MKKIIVPLDGSAFAEQAVSTARAIAARTGAALEFVLVHELVMPPARVSGAPVIDPRLDTEIRSGRRAYLERLEKAERERGPVPVTAIFREGRAAEEIAAQASEAGADLIVMTTHGRGGFERLWLGSVADGVVRAGTVPVLLVREGSGAEAGGGVALNRVLIAVSGSEPDDAVIAATLETTDLVRAHYTLVHVLAPSPTLVALDPDLGPPPGEMAGVPVELDSRRQSDAAKYLESLAEPFRDRGATVDTRLMRAGGAARELVKLAEDIGANVIAVGTAGRAPVSRFFMGSVADKVVRRASCSVLVVPSKAGV
jgi:nucleotide-binding universal stress UspA family protein